MLSLLLPEEEHPVAEAAFLQVSMSGAMVPVHWYAEVANVLAIAVRRGRISTSYRNAAIANIRNFEINPDLNSMNASFGATLRLCDRHALTMYDAAYLELARRLDLPLASLDGDLVRAAQAESVTLIGPIP
jgi:predicted nucleic acid-binding protein